MKSADRPPRPGRGVLIRALIAGLLTISLSATAVASAVLLEIDDVVSTFTQEGRTAIDIPEVSRAEAGDPRTFLILGSDERYGDKKLKIKPRSDTILLVRIDPDTKRIAMLSLPRDLKVKIPGAGSNKINAAYEIGGPRKTFNTIKRRKLIRATVSSRAMWFALIRPWRTARSRWMWLWTGPCQRGRGRT